MKHLILFLSLALPLAAQTTINGARTYLGRQDASGAASTAPVKSGTLASIPATCAAGDFYFATDGVPSRKLYSCTTTNTWVPIGYRNGTSDPATCTISELFVNTNSTPVLKLCTATNTWTTVGGSSGASTMASMTQASLTASTNAIYGPFGTTTAITSSQSANSVRLAAPWPISCTAQKLYVALGAVQPSGGSLTAALYVNGADSALTCSIAAGGTTCNDTTHTVSITAGDLISWHMTNASATGPTPYINATMVCQ